MKPPTVVKFSMETHMSLTNILLNEEIGKEETLKKVVAVLRDYWGTILPPDTLPSEEVFLEQLKYNNPFELQAAIQKEALLQETKKSVLKVIGSFLGALDNLEKEKVEHPKEFNDTDKDLLKGMNISLE